MTVEEFLKIKENTVISLQYQQEEKYVVDCLDAFGSGECINRVICATQIDTDNPKYIRVDKGNCQFWEIVGRIIYEK